MDTRPRYVPILKSRLGELTALKNMEEHLAEFCVPLIEIVPSDEMLHELRPPPTALKLGLNRILDTLRKHWRVRFDLIIDTHHLPATSGWNPTAQVVENCFESAQLGVIPAVRLSDSRQVLFEVGEAVRQSLHQPACIRLTAADLSGGNRHLLSEQIGCALEALGMRCGRVHLVLDFGSIADDKDVDRKARAALLSLLDIPHLDQWMSITLAGGAFPPDLSDIEPKILTRIDRKEVDLWLDVRRQLLGHSRIPTFGDYGVAHPLLPLGKGYGPPPQLRYTVAGSWLVLKYRRSEGFTRFFDICGEIAAGSEFTGGLTWGDEEIAGRTWYAHGDRASTVSGPGNGSTWRAIGTSHHIGFVLDHLATAGEP
ncbi:beta family protein [Nocardia sp. NPDC004722]